MRNPVTEEMALGWRSEYEQQNKTIERIALDHDRSPETIRKWLHKVDTIIRPPTRNRTVKPHVANARTARTSCGAIKAWRGGARAAHRRHRVI